LQIRKPLRNFFAEDFFKFGIANSETDLWRIFSGLIRIILPLSRIGMSFLNGVVDRVYVINMDKDTERMKSFDEQMKAIGIWYTRISAVVGSEVKHSSKLTEFCLNYCTDGMKGCALSHRLIWDDMVESGYSRVAIFEDDVILSKNFQDELKRAWKQLPKNFDLFYLGCHVTCGDKSPIPQIMTNLLLGSTANVHDTRVMKVPGSLGTHGYIISRKACSMFRNLTINSHIDLQISLWIKNFNLNAYSIKPLIVHVQEGQKGKESNLAETFPLLLNAALRQIQISETLYLDWALSENFMKIGGYNVNAILVVFMIIACVIPFNYLLLLGIWILAEYAVSGDSKNTMKFVVFIGAALALKVTFMKGIKLLV